MAQNRNLRRTVASALAWATLFAVSCAPAATTDSVQSGAPVVDSIAGRLLVAAPRMPDPRFAQTVIMMVRHDSRGAMGVVVNRPIGDESAAKLLEGMGVRLDDIKSRARVRVHYGGPVQPDQGFIVHSGDYAQDGTVVVADGIYMTTDKGVLHALVNGKGPERRFIAIGYAGWAPGQLERELKRKDWIVVPTG